MSDATDWPARAAAVVAADDPEWGRVAETYNADWEAAYCAEFRRYAASRGWAKKLIEGGWLSYMPREARLNCDSGADPAECARIDVIECEAVA